MTTNTTNINTKYFAPNEECIFVYGCSNNEDHVIQINKEQAQVVFICHPQVEVDSELVALAMGGDRNSVCPCLGKWLTFSKSRSNWSSYGPLPYSRFRLLGYNHPEAIIELTELTIPDELQDKNKIFIKKKPPVLQRFILGSKQKLREEKWRQSYGK